MQQSQASPLQSICKNRDVSSNTCDQILKQLSDLVAIGGPEPGQYEYTATLFRLAAKVGIPSAQILDVFQPTLVKECIHGFGYRKPHGYAGDFEMIDRIYTRWESPDVRLRNWDRFFHAQAAPVGVRNRKEVFKKQLRRLPQNARVLNIGCGPCRDLLEFFEEHPSSGIQVTNLDLDERAIEYGTRLCKDHLQQISFVHANILRYRTDERFDLIWSGGLFDYFSDRVFRFALMRLLEWAKPAGKVVIGNFNVSNTSRSYMELLGQWYLQHRSDSQLMKLARHCGVQEHQTSVYAESENVNLFLETQKSDN